MSDEKNRSLRMPERGIKYAGRLKKYPDGSFELLCCNRPVFREKGWEQQDADLRKAERRKAAEIQRDLVEIGWAQPEGPKAPTAASTERAARRAAAKVRDIALCNDFRWFVTLTLDAARVDRYDIREITRKLNNWLDNQVRRKGLKYVIVAERHEDGAVHFHGLVNDVPGFVPSGTWKVPGHKKPMRPRSQRQAASWATLGDDAGYHEVFNWDAWPLGFTTAIRLYGTYEAAVAYVCKYIRKQTTGPEGGKVGGRWYYSGGALRLPEVELVDVGLPELLSSGAAAYQFQVPEAGLSFGLLREFSKGET